MYPTDKFLVFLLEVASKARGQPEIKKTKNDELKIKKAVRSISTRPFC